MKPDSAGVPREGPAMKSNPVGIYEKALPRNMDWHRRLDTAGGLGFDFMEIAVDPDEERLGRLEWSAGERGMLRDAAARSGVPIFTIVLSAHRAWPLGSASSAVRRRGLDILRGAVDFAADTGIRVIQIAGYFVFDEKRSSGCRERFMEALHQGAERACAAGVMLGLENMDGEDVTSLASAMEILREIDSPWFQLYPDLGNLAGNSLDVCAELRRAAGHIIGIHVKDAAPGVFRRVPYGEGTVPFRDALGTLEEQGFAGPLTLEMWNDDAPDSQERIGAARTWLLGCLSESFSLNSGITKNSRECDRAAV